MAALAGSGVTPTAEAPTAAGGMKSFSDERGNLICTISTIRIT